MVKMYNCMVPNIYASWYKWISMAEPCLSFKEIIHKKKFDFCQPRQCIVLTSFSVYRACFQIPSSANCVAWISQGWTLAI